MKISITCEKPGWILYRMAEELKNRLTKHEVSINEGVRDADINYFLNYGYFRQKSDGVDVAWFTHFDPDHLADVWLRTAREIDHCIVPSQCSKSTLLGQGIPEEKISVVTHCSDARFVPKVRLGLVGKVYPGGRKGEHLVKALLEDAEIGEMVSIVAKQEGWGAPVNDLEFHDFYNSIDFLLITALLEAGPVPFIEALACGKLAIAPPIGNVPEFDHIEYKTGDLDDLKRVILETCRPIYEERKKLSQQVKKYDWAYWAAEHEKIFIELYEKYKDRKPRRTALEVERSSTPAAEERTRNSLAHRIYSKTLRPLRRRLRGRR